MQILEKCMEDMKAVYRLNEEKLDFNTKVLGERSVVNQKAKDMLKKRSQMFKQYVRDVKGAFKEQLAKDQKFNLDKTAEFKRFTK